MQFTLEEGGGGGVEIRGKSFNWLVACKDECWRWIDHQSKEHRGQGPRCSVMGCDAIAVHSNLLCSPTTNDQPVKRWSPPPPSSSSRAMQLHRAVVRNRFSSGPRLFGNSVTTVKRQHVQFSLARCCWLSGSPSSRRQILRFSNWTLKLHESPT